jgi:hypothetical protein
MCDLQTRYTHIYYTDISSHKTVYTIGILRKYFYALIFNTSAPPFMDANTLNYVRHMQRRGILGFDQ